MHRALTIVLIASMWAQFVIAATSSPVKNGITVLAKNHAQSVKCGLRLAKTSFSKDEPILLKFEVENSSNEMVTINLGVDRVGAFQFVLRQPNGELKELPRRRAGLGLTRVGKFGVDPHQTYSQQMILNEWQSFSQPGEYVLSLTKALAVKTSTGVVDCEDSELQFQLRPTDEMTLHVTCSLLLESIANNRSDYGRASDAAQALINVNNPLVVPYLERALEANFGVDSIVIEGLSRIGDHRSIEVLISILERFDRKMSQFTQARQGLIEISNRIPPSPDQALIKRALEQYR